MEQILPLVKKYDAAVIALPNDARRDPDGGRQAARADAARSSTSRPRSTASPIEDIVIDPLAMPIGADTATSSTPPSRRCAGSATSSALNMTCGASNVSFGMPDRHTLGAAFLPMAMTAGLTSAIMDARTPQIVEAVKAADLLLGHDEWGWHWIAAHRAKQAASRRERHDGEPRDRRRPTSRSTTSGARA